MMGHDASHLHWNMSYQMLVLKISSFNPVTSGLIVFAFLLPGQSLIRLAFALGFPVAFVFLLRFVKLV